MHIDVCISMNISSTSLDLANFNRNFPSRDSAPGAYVYIPARAHTMICISMYMHI